MDVICSGNDIPKKLSIQKDPIPVPTNDSITPVIKNGLLTGV
jgi:hypothetical protein